MDHTGIAELDRALGIPGVARVVAGSGGLAKVAIDAESAVGEIYLHGAHVTSWRPRGAEELLFVSAASRWEPGRAIRGGVPICFPWFADRRDDPKSPAHGFVRTADWRLESIVAANDSVAVSMVIESSNQTERWWPADFRLSYRATFGAELDLDLTLTNTGSAALRFEEALHSYFRVGDIRQTRTEGLAGFDYLDKTDGNRRKTQEGPIVVESETDRVYLETDGIVEVKDQALRRRIQVASEHSRTTVVWNPWIAKAKAMADFGDDEWPGMLCIETSNVGDFAVELSPGGQHSMRAKIRVVAN
jgi:glucose-6-phosphate 1-epimerase